MAINKESLKLFSQGAAAGAVALAIVGFSAGWVVTSGAADEKSRDVARVAVIDALVPICVAQFAGNANNKQLIGELTQISSWKQQEFVEAKGWATMPGGKAAADGVARECAARILALQK